jgi:hypothetical protein
MTLTERANGRKTTPAMASCIASHVWTMEEVVRAAIGDDATAVA